VYNNETFQRIEIPSCGASSEAGNPELPFIRQLIAIPECQDIGLSVNISGQTSLSNYNIYPAPDFIESQDQYGGVYLEEVYSRNASTYAQNAYLPGVNAEIVSTGYLRGQRYAEVYLYPIQFNPHTQSIIVYTHYQISLSFINPTTDVNVNTGIFNNVSTNSFLNYVSSGITAVINDNMNGNGNVQWLTITDPAQSDYIVADYLIICSEPFFEPSNPNSEVLRLANFRAAYNGFDVVILNANNIISDAVGFYYEGYPDPEFKKEQRIRTCIRRIYEGANAQHTYDGKLGYVLLVGDTESSSNLGMPTSYDNTYPVPGGGFIPSDYYYTCVTSEQGLYDDTGDLFIGRFCVDNNLSNGLTELHNVVEKTIFYESEATLGGWRDEIGIITQFPLLAQIYYPFVESLVPEYFTVNSIDVTQPNIHDNIYQVINDGVSLFTYFGHGLEHGWSVGGYLDYSVLQANLSNTTKAPIVNAIACQTGWFDAPGDCFAESMVSYSATDGFTGYLGASRSVGSGYSFPVIEDPPGYFQEYIPYAIFHNLSHITGEYVLESKLNVQSSSLIVQYSYAFNFFGDPALNVMAQGFQVTHDIELTPLTIISNEITVTNNATLTIPDGGELRFEGNGKLIIDEGATLVISENVVFESLVSTDLIIEGNLTIGENVTFTSSGPLWDVYLNNSSLQTSFENCNFVKCRLHNFGQSISVKNSSFDDCFMMLSHRGIVNISDNTSFNRTWLYLENTEDNNNMAIVKDCNFSTDYTMVAIDLWNYNLYDIDNNTIDGYYNGMQIIHSGYGDSKKNMIRNNTITNCTQKGILAYSSRGAINNNHISNNRYGVWLGDHSSMRLYGFSGAANPAQTQEIRDNDSYEVYASQYSFPIYLRYNMIEDDDNIGGATDALVYYNEGSGGMTLKDAKYNCWEEMGGSFNASVDLFPNGYIWEPTWCPGCAGGGAEPDEDMFEEAGNLFEVEDYTGAKTMYENLIDQYPESKYAKAAMQELFALEKYVTNDYNGLKQYYGTNATVQAEPGLAETGEYMATKCDIKLENWPGAIDYYENIILDPETLEDSIFAIIDLGYVYFVMENSAYKSAYTGNLVQYKPESKEQFFDYRNYLLSLIPGDQMSETMNENIAGLNEGELLQNVPNPFKGSTQILYKLNTESIVQLIVYNYTGQIVSTINEGTKTKGNHFIGFDATGLKNGIYFYSITINGKTTDSKKMTIMK
jgi:parallel beta-helix repeat protein